MAIRLLFTFIFTFILLPSFTQHNAKNLGARSSAMAGSGVANCGFWGAINNQATLGYNKQWGAGFYYENSFLVKELSLNTISVVMPTNKGSFALNIVHFGYSQYSESKVGIAYGMALSERFAVGVQMDYLRTDIGNEYGSKDIFSFEVGIIAKLTETVTLGAHVFNPIQAKLNDYNNERIPALIKLGVEWELADNFIAIGEIQSDIDSDIAIIAGLEYRIKEILYTRIGVGSGPNIFSFGVGLNFKNIRLDFSSSMNQTLGYSPQISLFYRTNK
ncbi:MAG: hypothetical protein KAG84_02955 [Bacteroidales bacterium]|nr:hypothetical protein [Bacteroidales bacterium]